MDTQNSWGGGPLQLIYFLAMELYNSRASAQGKTALPNVKYRQPCEKSPKKYMNLGTCVQTSLWTARETQLIFHTLL